MVLLAVGCAGDPPAVPPVTSTATLPAALVNAHDTAPLRAAGGSEEGYASSATGLPPGLGLSAAGAGTAAVSGTPAAGGTFMVSVTVAGSAGSTASTQLRLQVDDARQPITITTAALPGGRVGSAYSATVNSMHGTGLGTDWRAAGALPPGLSLTSAAGRDAILSGTPLVAGDFTVTLRASDSASVAERLFTIEVTGAPALRVDPVVLAAATAHLLTAGR